MLENGVFLHVLFKLGLVKLLTVGDAVTVLIWGSTWLAIKYQLGAVDPMVSVIYRFGLAAVLLLIFC